MPRPSPLTTGADRALAWLRANPPDSILSISDRLLLWTLAPTEGELAELAEYEEDLTLISAEQEEAGELHLDLPGLLIILWALERFHGQPRRPLRATLEAPTRAWAAAVASEPEPLRSAGLYWVREVGWWDAPLAPGPEPADPLLWLYHHTHLVYYATDYGRRPAPSDQLERSAAALTRAADAALDNADLLGEVLLALLALEPRDDARCQALADRLLQAQRPDGRFTVPDAEGDFDVEHHATCVAWLALTRLHIVQHGAEGD